MSYVFSTLGIEKYEIINVNTTGEPPVVTPPSTPLHPTPVWPTPRGINETEARRLCQRPILQSPLYELCKNFTVKVMQNITESCVRDLQVIHAQICYVIIIVIVSEDCCTTP